MSTAGTHPAALQRQAAAGARVGCRHRRLVLPPSAAVLQPLRQACLAAKAGTEIPQQALAEHATRRDVLLGSALLAALAAGAAAPPSSRGDDTTTAAAASSSSAADEVVTFSNPAQGYSLLRPASWEQVEKAGADSLFRDPEKKSTNVGVTVLPVMIASLEQFGDLSAVGERLLAAERAKESTLSVAMVEQRQRQAPQGPVYDFEYELESTRGRKRILSTVTIAARKLYIVNGNISCSKESCAGVEAQLPLLRRATQSLTVGSS